VNVKKSKQGAWTSVSVRLAKLDASAEELEELLDSDSGVTSVQYATDGETVEVPIDIIFAVESPISDAGRVVLAELEKRWPTSALDVIRLESVDGAELEREISEPAEEYVGVSEVAELLGVARQRVSQIVANIEGAPEPLARLRSGPVWTRSSWNLFNEMWERKSGRPRNEGLSLSPGGRAPATFRPQGDLTQLLSGKTKRSSRSVDGTYSTTRAHDRRTSKPKP